MAQPAISQHSSIIAGWGFDGQSIGCSQSATNYAVISMNVSIIEIQPAARFTGGYCQQSYQADLIKCQLVSLNAFI